MRVGVFGGSFDPVHSAHVAMAEAAATSYRLGRILFVPARLSPHKLDAPPADARHRVAMLALALAGRPDWTISFDELDREGPSYTVDTLRALASRAPGDELWLLMGTDALAGFDRWRQPDEILRLARIAAFRRDPRWGDGLVLPTVAGSAERVEVFDAGSVRISSTELRRDLSRGASPAGRVPAPVAEYITKHGLYISGADQR
jgi:nicotinate-nucleotide adenylyltransferase